MARPVKRKVKTKEKEKREGRERERASSSERFNCRIMSNFFHPGGSPLLQDAVFDLLLMFVNQVNGTFLMRLVKSKS